MSSLRVLLWLACCLALPTLVQGAGPALPPELVTGAEECGDCHEQEHEVWLKTGHATGFNTLSRDETARAMAAMLGIRRIKTDERCASCHFTTGLVGERRKAVSGVSCESCHGAGADWLDIHWDFGDAEDAETEDPAHRKQRWERSEAAGMIRPSQTVDLFRGCLSCHLVTDRELVEKAGHPVGGSFDLVAATQGEIRHNFLRTGGLANEPAPPERLRVLTVLGPWLDLEATTRALAASAEEGELRKALLARHRGARAELAEAAALAKLPQLTRLLELVPEDPASVPSRELAAGAEKLLAEARQFADSQDGSGLSALDALLAAQD